MNTLAKASIALWIATIVVFGYFFLKGATGKSTDNRTAVLLSPQEKDMVLGEMRTILSAINGVLNALAKEDMAKASTAAKSAGMAMAVDATPGLMAKLPMEFKSMGMSLHEDFDTLASDIEKGMTERQVIQRLGTITNKCVACHAGYRLGSIEE